MHFTNMVTVAFMATLAAAAEPQPYRVAVMPGLSLMRRSTPGYSPETTKCGAGDTCAAACGDGFDQCQSNDGVNHCYNPLAKQTCCQDGSGNSCDEGYYCTHNTKKQTVCCPDNMDLAACAAAYSVSGGLEAATSTTTTPASSSTTTTTTTTSTTTTTTTTTSTTSSTTAVTYSSIQVNATTVQPVITQTLGLTTTICPSSSGTVTPWVGKNSTISVPVATGSPPTVPVVVPPGSNAAAATSISALLVLAAGVVALL